MTGNFLQSCLGRVENCLHKISTKSASDQNTTVTNQPVNSSQSTPPSHSNIWGQIEEKYCCFIFRGGCKRYFCIQVYLYRPAKHKQTKLKWVEPPRILNNRDSSQAGGRRLFSQIGSCLAGSQNLSGLQMRRCKFIFSGKWDFDRKFTERLPAAAGCLTQQTATIHCMCTNTALLVLHYCTTLHWKFCTLLSTAAAHWGTICVHNETLTLYTENPCA